MASSQTYIDYANAAAGVLTSTWFGPDGARNWVQNYEDFWRSPNVVTTLTALMQLTGSQTYLQTAKNAREVFYDYFNVSTPPTKRTSPAYYDDEGWWGSMSLRLEALTQDAEWTQTASQIYVDLAAGWDPKAGGGVWWKRLPRSYPSNNKGSISNELYMDIGMGLYALAGSGPSYVQAAEQTWTWMQSLVDTQDLIWGNLEANGTRNPSNVPRTYTQGVILAPLWRLYQATGDATYLDAAEAIATAATVHMVWPDGILQEICEPAGDCGPQDTNSALFKGIFVRYLADFTNNLATLADPGRRTAASSFAAFLAHNADTLYANYPGGIYGMNWNVSQPNYQPTGNPVYDGCLQSTALDLFIAAAATTNLVGDRARQHRRR
jgi:predicted alpha-1,6-mannanase (GH76 family)